MLLRFGVENHGSIASYQQLQMVATTLKDAEDGLFLIGGGQLAGRPSHKALHVSSVAGVYGANAAGKSTLLAAFDFFSKGIVSSHTRVAASQGTPYYPFRLDEASGTRPSRYDVDIALKDIRYHYGYAVDGEKIVKEWLYSFDLTASRQVKTILFLRETNDDLITEVRFGKSLKGENKQIAKLVRPNSLFLSVAAQNAHPQLMPIFDFFYSKVVRRLDGAVDIEKVSAQLSMYFGSESERKNTALQFLSAADIGVVGIDFSKVPLAEKEMRLLQDFEEMLNRHVDGDEKVSLTDRKERDKVRLLHRGEGSNVFPIDLKKESAGTLSLLQLIGPALARLNEGGVLVVDELNSTLHPLVSRQLVRLFTSPLTNPGRAQLIFTTHDTNLLTGGLLRRDQIWFAEKDEDGATHIYSLSDIKVRADDNFERGYLTGRFGAIPFNGCSLVDFVDEFGSAANGGA